MIAKLMGSPDMMEEIEQCLPAGGEWCSLDKARILAATVIGMRPKVIVEIGVWMGGSLIPMLIALRENGSGRAIAIDPWSPDASKAGEAPENVAWWSNVDHDRAFETFKERLARHNVTGYCEILRAPSDHCSPPDEIDILHIDGNHSDQAVRDVERFCPAVRLGGIAVLDDVAWIGGNVVRAAEIARAMGFAVLGSIGTGIMMQRRNL
jgi:predicted O-methyltransferase YrrM